MANDRMWFMHKPTGLAVYIGKHYGGAWYVDNSRLAQDLDLLFDCALAESKAGEPKGWEPTEYAIVGEGESDVDMSRGLVDGRLAYLILRT